MVSTLHSVLLTGPYKVINYSILKIFSLLYLKASEATYGFCILHFLAFQIQKKKKSVNILLKQDVDQSVLEKNVGSFLFFK